MQVEVLLKTDLDTARKELFESLGLVQPCTGGVLLHSQTDDLDWFARELARLPFDFEVRQPPALRDALRGQGQRLMDMASLMAQSWLP
jgi:predicted DNA-binding transcriptional regulator YafY